MIRGVRGSGDRWWRRQKKGYKKKRTHTQRMVETENVGGTEEKSGNWGESKGERAIKRSY